MLNENQHSLATMAEDTKVFRFNSFKIGEASIDGRFFKGINVLFAFFVLVQFALYIYSVFYYPFSYTSTLDSQPHYIFLIISIPIATCTSVLYYNKRRSLKSSDIGTLLLFVLLISIVLLNQSKGYLANEHFCVILSLLAGLVVINAAGLILLNTLWIGVILIYILETVLFLWQLFLFHNDPAKSFLLTGSLQFSALFSCYITLHIPILFYIINSATNVGNTRKVLTGLCICITSLVLYYSHSRTSLLSFLIMLLLIHYSYLKNIIGRVSTRYIAVMLLLLSSMFAYAGYYLYSIKKLSAVGRLMMWNITALHLQDNFWFGVGLGKFPLVFPYWQAGFFKISVHYPLNYFLSAGECYTIYNEVLQLFAEIGFVGFVIVVLILVDFFKSVSAKYSSYLRSLKITVVGVLLFGITDNSLHMIPLMFILVLCLGTAYRIRESREITSGHVKILGLLILVCIILSSSLYPKIYKEARGVQTLNSISSDYTLSNNRLDETYRKLYIDLKYNGKFLVQYGQFLLTKDETDKGIRIFKESKKYFISYESVVAIANAFKKRKNYRNAIHEYQFLSNYIPSRFQPRYELVKLYGEIGDDYNAHREAKIILNMPVKKTSETVDFIRKEIRNLLRTN